MASTQYLRMTPLSGRTQAVEGWRLSCPGATPHPWQRPIRQLLPHARPWREPVDRARDQGAAGSCARATPTGWSGSLPSELPLGIYLRETPYTVRSASDPRLRRPLSAPRLSARHVSRRCTRSCSALPMTSNTARARRMCTPPEPRPWSRGAASARTTPTSSAPCAASLGIPARYVSGYLTHGMASEAHAASHAWADALIEDLGWVELRSHQSCLRHRGLYPHRGRTGLC